MATFVGSCEALNNIQPGEKITYYVGYLAKDKYANYEVNSVAKLAMKLEQDGKVILFARRLPYSVSQEGFEYLAIGRRHPPKPKPPPEGKPRRDRREQFGKRKEIREAVADFVIDQGFSPRPFPDKIKEGKFLTVDAKLYIIEQLKRFHKSETVIAASLGVSVVHVYRVGQEYDTRQLNKKLESRKVLEPV